LARPQQILMSSAAAGIAHRAEGELDANASRQVHWKDHGKYSFKGLPEPLDVVEVGENDIAPLHAPKSGRTAKKILPWWRRPLTLAGEAAMLLVAIGVGAWFVLQSPPTLAFAARDWVVVGNVQNHTNQNQLGAPLDAAFKIGLEQSQYVNVIPDMQVDNALKRMEKPAGTLVNRTIGSDIAMREGARALILPSLAQVGGRVQISAEVIDPHTGVTVYSDSTQADNEAQILPSTDKLLGKLRSRLGESLASIQKTSMPLQQITTGNMDALRAFSKAEEMLGRGKVEDGVLLLNEALRLDPDFGLAWARLATIQNAWLNDPRASYASLQKAEANRDRLSARERLAVDATIGQYQDADKWVANWQTAVQLYPDYSSAQQNLGLGLWWYQHKLKEAVPHFKAVAESNNPMRSLSWISLGAVETELGNYKVAKADMQKGLKLVAVLPHFEDVAPDLAQRDYAAVLARLDAAPAALPASIQAEKELRYAAVAIDRGQLDVAGPYIDKAARFATQAASREQQARVELARVAFALAQKSGDAGTQLKGLIDSEIERLKASGQALDGSAPIHLAIAAMLAARHGRPEWAREALDASREASLDHGYYDRAALWRTADCETQHISAPKDRIACLARLVDGREYFQTRVALMLAYRADGDAANARAQAQWLAAHRGQAVAELENEPGLIPNLLALRQASASTSGPAALGSPEF
jgi:putative peptide modification system cyclase